MGRVSPVADRALRALLRAPGRALEWIDGEVRLPRGPPAAVMFDAVRDTARYPESRLALEPDLHYARHEGLVLAWQHRGRTAFGIGGLNAPHAARGALLAAFVEQAAGHGIARQLVFPLRAHEVQAARAQGFRSVQVGVEASLDLQAWTLAGGARAHLRQMVRRATRRGVWTEEVDPVDVRDALDAVYTAWLASRRPSWRMRLLVGSPAWDAPFDRRYVVARSARGVEAFCTLLPGPHGVWGVDVMCRRPDATPGAMERLLADVASMLRDEGATTLSLGACPMAGIDARGPDRLLRAVFRLLYDSALGDRVFGFRGLHRFKRKFAPDEAPVYFAARPSLGVVALYRGCRMWGLM